MDCYCKYIIEADPAGIFSVAFDEYDLDGKPDDNQYCKEWGLKYTYQKSMVTGSSYVIVAINIAVTTFFTMVVSFEKRETLVDETISQF